MIAGAWHQFGDKSQKLALEMLQAGVGVGVVISPRDLAESGAVQYAQKYHDAGAHVLIDQQFYIPDSTVGKLHTYGIAQYRDSVSRLHQLTAQDLSGLNRELDHLTRSVSAQGVIAPAVLYEAGRTDIYDLNATLFTAAKSVGDAVGVPTYATVVLGRSITSNAALIANALAAATALNADGWYFGFEFGAPRIPAAVESVMRCCEAGLALANTGKPLLHAFAGPMALLSFGFGARAAGVGHSQNLWQFTPDRWAESEAQGGGGAAPPRYFSRSLWGTIIYPDEIARLPGNLRQLVITPSPFAAPVTVNPPFVQWGKWDAQKHLVYQICASVGHLAQLSNARAAAQAAITILDGASGLHDQIRHTGITLRDSTDSYQGPWRSALADTLADHAADYDYLELLS